MRHSQSIAGDHSLLWAVHHGGELVRGGFRSDSLSGEVSAEEVPYEGGLPHGVLPDEHHLRLGIELSVGHKGAVEEIEAIELLQRHDLRLIQPLQLFDHAHGGGIAVDHLRWDMQADWECMRSYLPQGAAVLGDRGNAIQ